MTTEAIIMVVCVNIVFLVVPGYFFWKILTTPQKPEDPNND